MNRNAIAEELVSKFSKHRCREFTNVVNDASKGLFVILKLIKNSETEVVAGDIATSLNISTARVAVALKTLECKKLIKTYKSNEDARKKVVMLTEQGNVELKEWDNKLVGLATNFLEKLTDDEVNQLVNIINKVM